MSREYRHIKLYEKEILELKNQGLTQREIAERLGFSKEQIKEFFHRYNRNQRKLSAGIVIKPKGRPRKDGSKLPPSIQQLSKLTQLQYELSGKERQIKRLEMENELMRDFLSLIEMSKTQGLKTKYRIYKIKSKHKCTAKQALNKMFKTYLEILSF